MTAGDVALWGLVAGIIHFVVIGILYGNPVVAGMYKQATETNPALRRWDSQPRYMVTQFVGTQAEVYAIAIGFAWLHPLLPAGGLAGALLLAVLFAALRVYPRFWNMWIQSTYPRALLAVEVAWGTVGTFVVVLALYLLG